MNDKESELHKIASIVIECCYYEGGRIDKEQLLGECRNENVVMTRCILARLLAFAGFTNTSIALVLHKTKPAVRHLLEIARDFRNHNHIYRVAEDESFKRYREEVRG